MASEILVSALLQFSKGNYSDSVGSGSQSIDMAGTHFHHTKLTVATGGTALTVGTVATLGWFWCKNHDATNFVELRDGASGADVVRVEAGEEMAFRWAQGATPYGVADTAAVELEYLFVED